MNDDTGVCFDYFTNPPSGIISPSLTPNLFLCRPALLLLRPIAHRSANFHVVPFLNKAHHPNVVSPFFRLCCHFSVDFSC